MAFFNKVKSLADTLSSIGQPLRDEEFTSFILNGLNSDYDSLVENVHGRDTPIPSRDLYSCLLSTEQRVVARRSAEVYTDGSSAHAAYRGGRPPYRPSGSKSDSLSSPQQQQRPPATNDPGGRTRSGPECPA